MKPLLHRQSELLLSRIIIAKPHALLLTAAEGMGKTYIAEYVAEKILAKPLESYPYLARIIPDEKNTITVAQIRELQKFLRLRTIGNNEIRRIVIVEHADAMTLEAQNAFLKVLEEPPIDTMIILTASSRQNMLATILSRVQEVSIKSPDINMVKAFFSDYPEAAVTQSYHLSGGAPGLISALLENNKEHPLTHAVQQAKALLQQDAFTRLAGLEAIKQKTDALQICQALERIATAGLSQASQKKDRKKIEQWHKILQVTADAQDKLQKNVQTKLALTHLMLHL